MTSKQSTAVAVRDDTALAPAPGFDLTPTSLAEAKELATLMANSDLVPKDYKNKAGNVLIAVQMGAEVGLQPMAALQNIAVINGRPTIWGDALIALLRAHPLCVWWEEGYDHEAKAGWARSQRRGDRAPREYVFSMEDAKRAKLIGKAGPWTEYPTRMCMLRARGFLARDLYADVLKGLSTAEEAMDVVEVRPSAPQASEPEAPSRTSALRERLAQRRQAQVDEGEGEDDGRAPMSSKFTDDVGAEAVPPPDDDEAIQGELVQDDAPPPDFDNVLAAIKDAPDEATFNEAMTLLRQCDRKQQGQAAPFVRHAKQRLGL